ncbi:MAG: hypothetical protein Q4B43_10135 [Bacteroidota bacterium]|nr:hypothetical protein [Bacteroidota bacterium]
MASKRNLKKDVNYVFGNIIEAVYISEIVKGNNTHSEQAEALVKEAVESFDNIIAKINNKKVENKKAHFKQINVEFENSAKSLIEKVNQL